ncbi:MAG: helix-turn-helix transcriptional regulator [Eubacteriales bacterium]|nr:helix-turn-helix transcriptional regulator [Eubacteriales bacterium]
MTSASQSELSQGNTANSKAKTFLHDALHITVWRQLVGCAAVFAAFYLLFSLSTMQINAQIALVYGSSSVSTFYALGLVATAAGFAVFGLPVRPGSLRRTGLIIVGLLYAASLLCVQLINNTAVVAAASLVCPFTYGYLGGAVHDRTAMLLQNCACKGRLIGIAFCCTVCVQFLIQSAPLNSIAYAILLLMILVVVLAWLLQATSAMRLTAHVHAAQNKELWIVAAVVAAVALMAGIYDGMAARLYAQHAFNLAGWTRLMVGVGAVFSGFLFDRKRLTQINIIILCAALVNTVAILLLFSTQSYLVSHLLFTAGMGFYMVYVFVSFMDAAPESSNPPFWAGAGRIVHSLAMSVTTAFAGVFGAMQPAALNAVTIALFAVTLLLFLRAGRLYPPKEAVAESSVLTNEERARLFCTHYKLTPRETDVFVELTSGDDGVQTIADRLHISRRVLQRYISAIYEKTETKTRVGLIRLYTGFDATK